MLHQEIFIKKVYCSSCIAKHDYEYLKKTEYYFISKAHCCAFVLVMHNGISLRLMLQKTFSNNLALSADSNTLPLQLHKHTV